MFDESPFEIIFHHAHGVAVVCCTGELDMASGEVLLEALKSRLDEGPVVIDASEITFLDCSGLSVLIEAHRSAAAHGRPFAVAAPSPAVLRLLDLTDLVGSLDLYSCVPSAVRAAARESELRQNSIHELELVPSAYLT